jgi:hypothetical protein
LSVIYEVSQVPVHSVLNMKTREMAISYPKGDIQLGFCEACGFVSNLAFDPSVHEYSSDYEETQGFSGTFNDFHHRLATRLIERHQLHDKDIIEIGCGKGEFLTLLCELGPNRGVGFDPAYVPERHPHQADTRIRFVKDFFSATYTSACQADFVCCKMTLEHIHPVADFVGQVRSAIGDRFDTIVFFQIPNVSYILRETAFWDIYYEHCSYFSLGSLARLFRRCGFDVLDLSTDYDDQYLMIEARPNNGKPSTPLSQEEDVAELARNASYFADNCRRKLDMWKQTLSDMRQQGKRVVLWGGGSKGVSFLTALGIRDEVGYVVDINPYKQGMYMAGTGHEIVSPTFLKTYQPDLVIVMNPIYQNEIRQDLDRMGIHPELMTVQS